MTIKRLFIEATLAGMLVWAAVAAGKLYEEECETRDAPQLTALQSLEINLDTVENNDQLCENAQATRETP